MIKDITITDVTNRTRSMNPKKFLLWMFMVSIVMVFAALTSAYIVRQAEGNWLQYDLPSALWITTGIILASSVTMHWGLLSLKKDNKSNALVGVIITFVLGIVFLIGQVKVWEILVANDVYFVGNPGGSFLYVLTGFHGVHLVSGLIYLLIVLVQLGRNKISSEKPLAMELSTTYWHFLDGLWLYLYVFLLLNH